MIDEDFLNLQIKGLLAVKEDINQINNDIGNLIVGLRSIQLEGSTIPLDITTNLPMTNARRQEVYDACISVSRTILTKYAEMVEQIRQAST